MSTESAVQQSDRAAWHGSRIGRFTASTMSVLMTEPRSKAAKEAGEMSETTKKLISTKATERVTGIPVWTPANFDMKRGTLLEHAAVYVLSQHWQPVFGCTWMPIGENSGATPDGLLKDGTPLDIKCPSSQVDIMEFADQVKDNDWESLLAWNKSYAWQIATQAMAAGAKEASLLYFTDRLHTNAIDDDDAQVCNAIMEAVGDKMLQLTGQIYDYRLYSDSAKHGYAFAARRFTIPQEAFDRINSVLKSAEVECQRMVERYSMFAKPNEKQAA
jgi:hypothetical protein